MAEEYETDKFESGYVDTYVGLMRTLGTPDPAICEVGVFRGGSLKLWQNMVPNHSVIVGVDRDPNAKWPPDTVKVVADQQDPTLATQLQVILAKRAGIGRLFDLIVDDASHQGQLTYKTFMNLWPLVAPGGFYVIEDWLVGFDAYPTYDDSMLNLAMMLLVHFNPTEPGDIHFITYQAGLIIIRKKVEES